MPEMAMTNGDEMQSKYFQAEFMECADWMLP